MNGELTGKKIAILATNGFEQAELVEPRKALLDEGAEVELIAPSAGNITGWDEQNWGDEFGVDIALAQTSPNDYDALLLPGGVLNADKLRTNKEAIKFVRAFFDAAKPVAAICHAPWILIEAGVAKGRKMTSYASIQTDLKNAGARWMDEPVVTDNGLVTSRKPDDIPSFNEKMIEEFAEGRHPAQSQPAPGDYPAAGAP